MRESGSGAASEIGSEAPIRHQNAAFYSVVPKPPRTPLRGSEHSSQRQLCEALAEPIRTPSASTAYSAASNVAQKQNSIA